MGKRKMPVSRAKTAYGLLSEIRRLILKEPKRYNQSDWLSKQSEGRYDQYPSCGTVGCVAGWVVTLKKSGKAGGVWEKAGKILGITDAQQERLFFGDVTGAPQTDTHAKSGAAHIARFMKKYAKQLKATRV